MSRRSVRRGCGARSRTAAGGQGLGESGVHVFVRVVDEGEVDAVEAETFEARPAGGEVGAGRCRGRFEEAADLGGDGELCARAGPRG
ncbi:hypothetical protein [Streptomyces sp. 840.1]|uniref:hypothetical protein n=1 Tax=Streptomyces sp. 840.1 TaxID=2485152 RepID=UPI0021A536A0|nr:hypothetical protein [Streptomyces sp. 840.1]